MSDFGSLLRKSPHSLPSTRASPSDPLTACGYVFGAGGHGRVVAATLVAAGTSVLGLFDDDLARAGDVVDGITVLGRADRYTPSDGALVLGVGDNRARERLAARFGPETVWATAVHPSALVHESIDVGDGAVIFAGAIVQPGARLGRHVIVNTGAVVEHDCVLEDFAHVAPGVHLGGSVVVGEGALVGVGACAVPGTRVGAWTTVGAGAVVVKPLPERVVAVGMPARPVRPV